MISVIIPTLNRSFFLETAIKSVLNQSLLPFEVIVVDNGSDDNTKCMIKKNFPNIKYIYYSQKGVSKARNLGIKISKGDWICFLDSDDEWHKHKIEKQINFVKSYPECKFIHTNEVWYKNGFHLNQLKKHKKTGGYIFEKCLKICCISPSSTMIHRSIFENHGFFDEEFQVCEDYEMWLRISSKEKIFFLEDNLLFKYGGHEDQLSKKYWGMDRFRVRAIEKNLKDNYFSKSQNKIAIKYLLDKLKIIIDGAKKRKNIKIFKDYNYKYKLWEKINNEIS